jgi:hypothetical protein
MAYKIKGKNKISKESKNLKIARDKGVNFRVRAALSGDAPH